MPTIPSKDLIGPLTLEALASELEALFVAGEYEGLEPCLLIIRAWAAGLREFYEEPVTCIPLARLFCPEQALAVQEFLSELRGYLGVSDFDDSLIDLDLYIKAVAPFFVDGDYAESVNC